MSSPLDDFLDLVWIKYSLISTWIWPAPSREKRKGSVIRCDAVSSLF